MTDRSPAAEPASAGGGLLAARGRARAPRVGRRGRSTSSGAGRSRTGADGIRLVRRRAAAGRRGGPQQRRPVCRRGRLRCPRRVRRRGPSPRAREGTPGARGPAVRVGLDGRWRRSAARRGPAGGPRRTSRRCSPTPTCWPASGRRRNGFPCRTSRPGSGRHPGGPGHVRPTSPTATPTPTSWRSRAGSGGLWPSSKAPATCTTSSIPDAAGDAVVALAEQLGMHR